MQNLIEQTPAFIILSPMDRETLIFLHIPKTAGTTLNRIIEWQYSPFEIFTIDPYRIRATPERLKRLPEERRRRLRVVRGHMLYGVHKCAAAGCYLCHHASRPSGQGSLSVLFCSAQAA